MANILVYIELADERPIPGSLEALGVARRVSDMLGATTYALLPCTARPSYGDDDAIAILSRQGADKVVLVTHPTLTGPPLHVSHAGAVIAACTALPPALLLFASTSGARDLAPRVAARLAAAYLAEPRLELADGALMLTRWTTAAGSSGGCAPMTSSGRWCPPSSLAAGRLPAATRRRSGGAAGHGHRRRLRADSGQARRRSPALLGPGGGRRGRGARPGGAGRGPWPGRRARR